jgi:nucleoside-diphosphate-sugar epimerase
MRVAVAGASGFIGSAAIRALRAAGHSVIGLGRDEVVTAPCDALVWAAGRREASLESNRAVHVTAAVEAARRLRVSRAIYLSSGECYGDASLPYREDGETRATTDYARAKLEGERAMSEVAATTALRLGVVYGPGQQPHMMIPQLVAALRARRVFAMTDGVQTRDFVYVDDVAEAIVAALAAPPLPVVNIGSGDEVAVRDVARTIARVLGANEALLGFGQVPMRSGEAMRYVLDVSCAAQELHWRARTSLETGATRL